MTFFGYTCECSSVRCRRKIYLEPHEYEYLANMGIVVHVDHGSPSEISRSVRAGFARPSSPRVASLDAQLRPSRAESGLRVGQPPKAESGPLSALGVEPFA